MFVSSNYNLSQLFLSKEIIVFIKEDEKSINYIGKFKMIMPTLRDFMLNNDLRFAYDLITSARLGEALHMETSSDLSIIKTLLLNIGKYDKFRKIYDICLEQIPKIIPNFTANFNDGDLKIGDITITDDIWDYVIYLLKLNSGEKVQKPILFEDENARKFYLAQRANERKMEAIRQKNHKPQDDDSIIKILLSIIYSFPAFTIDYLFDQTMAQIQWLQKKAAGAVSYEVNAKAYAAGNVKKGKKLDFFIK